MHDLLEEALLGQWDACLAKRQCSNKVIDNSVTCDTAYSAVRSLLELLHTCLQLGDICPALSMSKFTFLDTTVKDLQRTPEPCEQLSCMRQPTEVVSLLAGASTA